MAPSWPTTDSLWNGHRFCVWAALLLLVAAAAGCMSGPRLVEAAGAVTLAGKPVIGASVIMEPVAGGPVAGGMTDAEGMFFMSVANRRGLPLGAYRVAITLYEVVGADPARVGDFTNAKLKWGVPERYGRLESSGLEVTLDRDRSDLLFELEP